MEKERKLKIVYFYQYFGTPQGGWSTRVYELCKRWVAQGHEVTVITTPYDKSDIPRFKGLRKKFEYDGIKVIVLNFAQSNKQSSYRRVWQFVKYAISSIYYALTLRYDTIICSSGPITIGIPGLAAKWFRGKKFVFEVRDIWPAGAIQLKIISNKTLIKLSYWFEALCYKNADLIVACSQGMKDNIFQRFGYKHIEVVSNACDVELFSGKQQDIGLKDTSRLAIVYTGSLGVMDDCMQIMRAIKEFNVYGYSNVYFVIAGEGIDRQRMMDYAKDNDITNVEFRGLIPKTEVVSILQNAYCSIVCFDSVPILNTVSPNKLFDSFAAGVPVIQTTNGWIAALLNETKSGINVEAGNEKAMAQAFKYYIDNPDIRASHAANAFGLAKGEFSRDHSALLMINAIASLHSPLNRKHIWVINQFAGHEQSGWGERHYFMSKYWQDQGYRVSIISGSFNHMFNNLPYAPHEYNFERLPYADFIWVKTPIYNPKSVMRFWSMLAFAWKCFSLPAKKIGYPSDIIVSSMPIFPIVSGRRLKKKYNAAKLVFEIRDIWPLTLNELGEVSKWHPISLFIGWFEKFGYKHADKIVSLLPFAADHIVNHGGAVEKIAYIPNGLEAEIMEQDKLSAEIRNSIPTDKFIIGYTGTHSLANALEFLVEAASILNSQNKFFFILVGEGYKKPFLQQQAAYLDNIKFFPKLPKSQMQDLIKYFDVCFVGRQDSALFDYGVSGNKYFDYMLGAKPILDANNSFGSPAELAGAGIRVKAESGKAIAQGIEMLYAMSTTEREHMGKAGYDYVTQHHSTSILAGKYMRIFDETEIPTA